MDKEQKQIFSLRKLSVGLASVAIGSCLFATNANTAKADSVSDNSDQSNHVQENTEQQTISTQDIQQGQTGHAESQENQVVDEVKAKLAQADQSNVNDMKEDHSVEDSNNKTTSNSIIHNSSDSKESQENPTAEKTILKTNSGDKAANQSNLAPEMLKESKVEANQDWADPAKQGFHKTNVGWTKHNVGDGVYNAIAEHSEAELHGDHNSNWKPPASEEVNVIKQSPIYGINFKNVTIKKADLTAGNTVLLDTIAYLYDKDHKDNPLHESGDWNQEGNTVTVNGYKLGYISNTYANDERDYVFHVTDDAETLKSVASDLHFSFDIAQSFISNQDNHANVTQDQPLTSIMINNGTETFKQKWFVPAKASERFKDLNGTSTDHSFNSDRFGNLFIGNFQEDSRQPHQNIEVHRIFKYQSTQPIAPSKGLFLHAFGTLVDKDGKVATTAFFGNNIQVLNLKEADKNMSINQLFNDTKDKELKYSKQDDGSYLVCVNINTDDLKVTDQQIIDTTKKSETYITASKNEQNEILKRTLDYYHKRDNHPLLYNLAIYRLYQDSATPYRTVVNEVTPNATWDTSKAFVFDNKPNGATANMSMYRKYDVQYVDEIKHIDKATGKEINKVLKHDTIFTQTGKDVDYKVITSDQYQLSPCQASEIKFKVPESEKANPDPIVIKVLGKEDYERDRTYKVVRKVPTGYKTTKDEPYDEFHLHMTREVKGRDANGKIQFGNWTLNDPKLGSLSWENSRWKWYNGFSINGQGKSYSQNDFKIDGYTPKSDVLISGVFDDNQQLSISAPNKKYAFDDIMVGSNSNWYVSILNSHTLHFESDFKHENKYIDPDKLLPDTTFYITYTPNKQSSSYQFVDDDNKDAKGQPTNVGAPVAINGVTDQTVKLNYTKPENYDLVDNQPTEYKFKASANKPVMIHLKHHIDTITCDHYDDKVKGLTNKDLNTYGTRTIIFNLPEGVTLDDAFVKKYHVQDGNRIVQKVHFGKTATIDRVTNKVTGHSEWTPMAKGSSQDITIKPDGTAEYNAVKLPVIPGYRLSMKKVPIQSRNRLLSLFAVNFTAIPQPSKPTDDKGQASQATQAKPDQIKPENPVVPNDHKDQNVPDQSKEQPTQATDSSSQSNEVAETPAVIPSEPAQVPETATTSNSDQVKETETKSDDQTVSDESDVETPSEPSNLASKKFKPVTNVVSHKIAKNAYKAENKPLKAAKVTVQKSASTPDVSSVQASPHKVNDSQALPQTGEAKDNSMVYSAFALSLGLDLLVGAYVEKKKKES